MKSICLACILFISISLSAQTFKFTAIPDQDAHRLEERFSVVAQYLQKQLGVDVIYVPVKSYSASVAAFKNNEVQLAWFGGLSGVQARLMVPGSVALAQGEEDTRFISYFIAHASTGLEPADHLPKNLSDFTFTFGSKGSTSGRLMPEFHIRKQFGKAPRKIFRRVGFSGDHSKTIALVQAGSYQVGAVNYKVYERELAAGKIDESKVRIIWKTPYYPDYNWTIRGDVDQSFGAGFIQKVQDALLNMKDPELLEKFPRSKFIPANNKIYKPILDTAREIGLIES